MSPRHNAAKSQNAVTLCCKRTSPIQVFHQTKIVYYLCTASLFVTHSSQRLRHFVAISLFLMKCHAFRLWWTTAPTPARVSGHRRNVFKVVYIMSGDKSDFLNGAYHKHGGLP